MGLERSGDAPVYGPNLRASCRLEDAGWLRILRTHDLRLAGAQPLLHAKQEHLWAEQRAAETGYPAPRE